jgi:hypothetical protein
MEYKATLDLKAKIITGCCAVAFTAITIYNIGRIDFGAINSGTTLVLLFSVVLVVAVTIGCYLLRPLKYEITHNQLIVRRPIRDLIIERTDIKSVLLPTPESMKWTVRIFGNGGLFGYFGSFRNKTYGGMTWYATRTNNYVMIVTHDNTKIVITPDDTGIVNDLNPSSKEK